MALERLLRRYSAYYRGWCQAFGDHEISSESDEDINWIFGEGNIGLILSPQLRKRFFRELMVGVHGAPTLELAEDYAQINEFRHPVDAGASRLGLGRLIALLEQDQDIYLFQTYHFCYPEGTRILTFSIRKPLMIMYKEVGPMQARIL